MDVEIQIPDGRRDINELRVPVGVPIKLTMASEDVIHDFAIPAFRIKKDVVPGHYTTLWFTATKTGKYHLYCDQYCGTSHSAMIGWVIVMEPAEYSQWLSGGSSGKSLAEAGADLYKQYACSTCHDIGRGPSFVGLYGSTVKLSSGQTAKADDAYIRESILNPSGKIVAGYTPIMPTFQGQLGKNKFCSLPPTSSHLQNPKPTGKMRRSHESSSARSRRFAAGPLSQRPLRMEILALHHGSQKDCVVVSRCDYLLFLRRRRGSNPHALEPDRTAGVSHRTVHV